VEQAEFPAARILVADDQELNVLVLEQLLAAAGYAFVRSTTVSTTVPGLVAEMRPDLIALDLHMPLMDGFELLERLAAEPAASDVPIVVLTADGTDESKRRALRLGARDFLTKPLDPLEVILRVRNHLATRFAHLQLQQANEHLEARVRARTRDLELANMEMLDRLARAAEYRDDQTGRHTVRVGRFAAHLALATGLSHDEVRRIREVAPLHDLGKIGVPDAILLKHGPLDDHEWHVMRSHARLGARVLAGGTSDRVRLAHDVARYHHERWDGRGYEGLAGTAIPFAARLVAVADVFDALTHERPYKHAWDPEEARTEIIRGRAGMFDPDLVELFAEFDPGAMVDPAEPEVTADFRGVAERDDLADDRTGDDRTGDDHTGEGTGDDHTGEGTGDASGSAGLRAA
jgi:putative two-component system response regulator